MLTNDAVRTSENIVGVVINLDIVETPVVEFHVSAKGRNIPERRFSCT